MRIRQGRARTRSGAFTVALALVAASMAILPFGYVAGPDIVGFLPFWCATVLLLDVLTCSLLLSRYWAGRDVRVLALAAGYATSAAAVGIMVFTLPGVVFEHSPIGQADATSAWLWLLRHLAPPVLIAVSLGPWPRDAGRMAELVARRDPTGLVTLAIATLLGPGLLVLLLQLVPDALPLVRYPATGEFAGWAEALVVVVDVAAVAAAAVGVAGRSPRNGFEDWAVVAAVAWLVDAVLAVSHEEMDSVGYYGARVLGIAASLIVLAAMFHEIGRIHQRVMVGAGNLEEQVTELLEAARQRDHIIAAVSHDMRSPLAGLAIYLEALRDEQLPAGPVVEQMHQGAWRITRRLTLLTEDLLTAATSHRGGIALVRRPVILREQVEECVECFPDLRVHLDVPTGLVVDADPLRLQQVLTNLVHNAQRYGAEPVTIEADRAGAFVRVVVRDEGPGVPPAFVPHLFERYTRTTGADTRGAGLGLAVVADLVRAHGGAVGYEPARRAFVLTLPAGPAQDAAGAGSSLVG